MRRAIPASRLAQWYLAYCLPALLLLAGESAQLFTLTWDRPGVLPASTVPTTDSLPVESPASQEPASPLPQAVPVPPPAAEPQPLLANAVEQPFSLLARELLDRSLVSQESLRLRREVLVSIARAENSRRLAEEEAQTRQSLAKHKIVAQAMEVGTLHLEGTSEGTLRLEIYDSFESLERGIPDNGADADVFSVDISGQRFETVDRYAGFVATGGPVEITNYGYAADHTPDRNSNRFATGLGGVRPLIPGISAALSRSLSSKLGAKPGAVIEFLDGRGRSYLVTYDDHSPQRNLNIDVYRPTFGSNRFRAHVKAARVVRQGESGVCHARAGLPSSLRNYRAALLQLAGENRPDDAAAPGSTPEAGARGFPEAQVSDFALVQDSLPLAQRLDQFANIPFSETGFDTSQQIASYLEAGAQSLHEGAALVRKHGLKPAEFPPILRMRSNLEAAQQTCLAIAAGEAQLRQAYQECAAEIFQMQVRAAIEEDPLALAEVQRQLQDLQCTQSAILADLENHRGGLHPVHPAGRDQPAQVAYRHDPWSVAPDS